VANLGVREAMVVVTLAPYGVNEPQALLMSMILFSILIVMAVIGAAYQIIWAITEKKSPQPLNNASEI
jgi:hypothetical protein